MRQSIAAIAVAILIGVGLAAPAGADCYQGHQATAQAPSAPVPVADGSATTVVKPDTGS